MAFELYIPKKKKKKKKKKEKKKKKKKKVFDKHCRTIYIYMYIICTDTY